MGFLNSIFGRKQLDEPISKQKKDVVKLPLYKMGMVTYYEGVDSVPESYVEFEYDATNPIPVNGPIGETVYINRLRSESGSGFLYHRIGSFDSPVTDNPVDLFELLSTDGKMHIKLYFDFYYFRRSISIPKNLTQIPWHKMKPKEKQMCKINAFGVTHNISNFPNDLTEAIANSPELKNISSGLGTAMSNKICVLYYC